MNPTIYLQMGNCGNMGNRLFQYAWLHKLQCLLPDAEIVGFEIPELALRSPKITLPGRVLHLKSGHRHNPWEIAHLLSAGVFDSLQMDAYVQRLEYYSRWDFPRFAVTSWPQRREDLRNKIVLNIRAGDILTNIHADYGPVPVSWLLHVTEKSKKDPVLVGQLSDDPYSCAIREAFPGCEIKPSTDALNDFQWLLSATEVACSVSTFSFLGTWLSDAQTIHFPVKGLFHPLQRPDINLLPMGDPRYQFYVFPEEKWRATPAQLAALSGQERVFSSQTPQAHVRELIKY